MDINHHTKPDQLEHYSFLWSQARLVIGAVALFIGGVPPVLRFNPIPSLYGLISSLLTLAWIISGVASAYLLYRWFNNNQMVFKGKAQMDTVAFLVSIVTGFNLGLTGLMGKNIGMSIASSQFIFVITGIIYLATAWHLHQRWNASGKKVF